MENDVQRWIGPEGIKYLQELGLETGQVLVDFGCNEGHYSIPAATLVGPDGRVYAIDREKTAVDRLKMKAQGTGLNNISPIISDKPAVDLTAGSADLILIYDVLHYLNANERKTLFLSAGSVLKNDGLLSVFPKHNQMDLPMWHLADLNILDIINEIEECGFELTGKNENRLIHDDVIERGVVINFRKSPTT